MSYNTRRSHVEGLWGQKIFKYTNPTANSNGLLSIFVVIIILVYGIALVFGLGLQNDEIYYLSDNLYNERYAYLLCVKTGFDRSAGTTSNVVIRIKGTQGQSRPHVLNFPDPQSSLLQRHVEDWFVLTTEKHLGQLDVVEMWHDSIGFSPTWQCRYVVIFDLQLQQEWLFKINKTFSVTFTNGHYCQVRTSSTKKLKQSGAKGGQWQLELQTTALSWYTVVTLSVSAMTFCFALELFIVAAPHNFDADSVYIEYATNGFHVKYLINMIVSCIGSFLLHMALAYILRNSASKFQDREKYATQYSHRTGLICWAGLVALLLISLTYLIWIDIFVPIVANVFWIVSFLSCVILQFAMYYNGHNLMRSCFSLCSHQIEVETETNIAEEAEKQRELLHYKFGGMGLRPYLEHLYTPINYTKIPIRKLQDETLVQFIEAVEDIVMIAMYLLILNAILLVNKDVLTYYSNKNLIALIDGQYVHEDMVIKTNNDVYKYLKTIVLPALTPTQWNPQLHVTVDERISLLTVARIRQNRVRKECCEVPDISRFLSDTCYTQYSLHCEELGTFRPNWVRVSSHEKVPYMWKNSDPKLVGNLLTVGKVGSYPGRGYCVEFAFQVDEFKSIIDYLKSNNWIDRSSRFLKFEAIFYNVHFNFMSLLSHDIELTTTGNYLSNIYVQGRRLLLVDNQLTSLSATMYCVVTFWLAILIFKKKTGLVRSLTTFFKDIWNTVDMMLIILSIMYISLLALRASVLHSYITEVKETEGLIFMPFNYLLRLDYILMNISFPVILAITIRLWKFVRCSSQVFRIMEMAMITSTVPLICALLCQIVLTAAYSVFAIVVYGAHSSDFQGTLGSTLTTLLLMSINIAKSFDLATLDKVTGGYVYLSSFYMLMIIIYNIYKSIVIMSYVRARQFFSNELGSEYTAKDYIKDRFMFVLKKLRMTAGEAYIKRQKVSPKADEFRYANSFYLNTLKMKCLEHIALCYLRNIMTEKKANGELQQYDFCLIHRTLDYRHRKKIVMDTKEVFFKGRLMGQSVQFIDERRISLIEKIVASILLTPDEKASPETEKKKGNQVTKNINHVIKDLKIMWDVLENINVGRAGI